jgi:hypothetical protein
MTVRGFVPRLGRGLGASEPSRPGHRGGGPGAHGGGSSERRRTASPGRVRADRVGTPDTHTGVRPARAYVGLQPVASPTGIKACCLAEQIECYTMGSSKLTNQT